MKPVFSSVEVETAMEEQSKSYSSHILCVIPGCGGGDWPPLIALAVGLKLRGYHMMMVCDSSTVDAVQSAGLPTICLPSSIDLATFFEPALARLFSLKKECIQDDENPLVVWGRSCVSFVKRALGDWSPTFVITSLLGLGLGDILAKEYAVPRCFFNPSFCFDDVSGNFFKDDFSEVGSQMYRHWLMPFSETADLILHATYPEFDLCPEVLSHHHHVGPLFWEMPGKVDELLNKDGPPWILLTLSTSPQPGDLAIVQAVIEPLASMNVRVLVTLTSSRKVAELGRVPANFHVTAYIPHSLLLPRCNLVISHAGHGIVMKAITYGIPMVLVPWGRDQPGVASRAKQLGPAKVVPRSECSVAELTHAIDTVYSDPEYTRRAQELAYQLKNRDGVANAIDCIERMLNIRQ